MAVKFSFARSGVVGFIFLLYIENGLGMTFYCDPSQTTVISGQVSGTIRTVRSGRSFYDNNMECSWILDGGIDTRIQLNVTGVDLQWAPTYTLCSGYDNLQIRDGNTSSADSLVTMCGSLNPYEVISSGRYVYLKFKSNEKNFYDEAGITIEFTSFSNKECPPNWRNLNNDCYKIETRKQTEWTKAQTFCGYSQSNLVTMNSGVTFDFIQDFGEDLSLQLAWIGLNDIVEEGIYEWLNNTSLSLDSKLDKTTSAIDKDCVAHDFNKGVWVSKYCVRDNLYFICQRLKVGNTPRKKLPREKIDDDNETASVSVVLAVILGILVGIVVVIVGIVLYCFCCLKQKPRKPPERSTEFHNLSPMRSRPERVSSPSDQRNGSVQERTQPTAPPSYEEALSDDVIK